MIDSIRKKETRTETKARAAAHFKANGECMVKDGRCDCPQHDLLDYDKDHRNRIASVRKDNIFAMEEEERSHGSCKKDSKTCECRRHQQQREIDTRNEIRALKEDYYNQNFEEGTHVSFNIPEIKKKEKDRDNMRKKRSARDPFCKGTQGTCNCEQHKYERKIYRQAEIRRLNEDGQEEFNPFDSSSYRSENSAIPALFAESSSSTDADKIDSKKQDNEESKRREAARDIEKCYSDQELKEIDDTLAFGPLQTDSELYAKIAPKLSFDNLTVRCCAICDCDTKCNDLAYEEITGKFIQVC
jgi:hypothetical protein